MVRLESAQAIVQQLEEKRADRYLMSVGLRNRIAL